MAGGEANRDPIVMPWPEIEARMKSEPVSALSVSLVRGFAALHGALENISALMRECEHADLLRPEQRRPAEAAGATEEPLAMQIADLQRRLDDAFGDWLEAHPHHRSAFTEKPT